MKRICSKFICVMLCIMCFFSSGMLSAFAEDDSSSSTGGEEGISSPFNNNDEQEQPILSEPQVEFTRDDIAKPIKAGEEFIVTVHIKNLSKDGDILSPAVNVSASEGLILQENTNTQVLRDIYRGSTGDVILKMKALDEISSPSQSIEINLKFKYRTGGNKADGSSNSKIMIPVQANKGGNGVTPIVQITRGDIQKVIGANETFSVLLTVTNKSDVKIENPTLFLTPTDSFALLDDASTKLLETIEPHASVSLTVKLQSMAEISSSSQGLGIEMKYRYTIGSTVSQGETSEKIWVPVQTNKGEGTAAPLLQITREEIKTISANQDFSVVVHVKNLSDARIETPTAIITPTDSIIMRDRSSSQILSSIKPKQSVSFTVHMKAMPEIAATAQGFGVDMKYRYTIGNTKAQGESSEKIWLPLQVKGKDIDSATPNLIIDNYSYGDTQVAAGVPFDLALSFRNTSTNKKAENVVVTLEPSEGLAVNSSSNTFYFSGLSASEKKSQSIQLLALPTAKTGAVKIDVTFKYEYISQNQRTQATSTQSISIPIYQPDRFEVELVSYPESIQTNAESIISLNYINKGKSDIANVRAEIVGDITVLSKVQNLGNFEPGKSGSIDFVLTPDKIGKAEFILKLTYEDPNMQEKVREFPVNLIVEEGASLDGPSQTEPISKSKGISKGLLGFSLAVIVLLALSAIFVWKQHKNKINYDSQQEPQWEDDDLFDDNKEQEDLDETE